MTKRDNTSRNLAEFENDVVSLQTPGDGKDALPFPPPGFNPYGALHNPFLPFPPPFFPPQSLGGHSFTIPFTSGSGEKTFSAFAPPFKGFKGPSPPLFPGWLHKYSGKTFCFVCFPSVS